MFSAEENEMLTRVGPGTPMGELVRRFWIPFLLSEELPAPDCPPLRVRLMGEDLVAFRATDGRVGLIDAYCAHRRAPLFFGRNEEGGLRCVYHGWKYDVGGRCIDMPSEPPTSNFKDKVGLTAYPVRERAGALWAYMGPVQNTPGMPALEWIDLPQSHRYVTKRHQRTNFVQAVEGGLDSIHLAFLHSRTAPLGTSGDTNGRTGVDMKERWKVGNGPVYRVYDTDSGVMLVTRREPDEKTYHWHAIYWLMPFYNTWPAGGGEGGSNASGRGLMWTPIDDEHTWVFSVTWDPDRVLDDEDYSEAEAFSGETIPGTYIPRLNKDNDYLIDRGLQQRESFTGINGFQAQDFAVQEGMGPIVDRTKEHLGTSDVAIIQIRRRLLRAANELREGIEPFPARHGDVYRVRAKGLTLPRGAELDDHAISALSGRV